ncbi:MAG TPA: DUF4287 domain-containing protein [Flavobacteriales bacterium]|nr:DUF4287 domain-containing protein [Flavobacteriales bacterium]HMR26900.1 DUF4287 domain-containing protein [Flavobacteriales bacterium]
MATDPDAALRTMIANLKEKTGRDLDAWVALLDKAGPAKHGERVAFLKEEHGLGHGYANLIALTLSKSAASTMDDRGALLDAQYAGAKAALRPIHDRIMKAVHTFGKEVDVAPMKTYVSLRRRKQFAIIQPSTATRVDVGINLKGAAATDRLEASGSFNSMVSHRVRLSDADQVDKELIAWLREAYERAG